MPNSEGRDCFVVVLVVGVVLSEEDFWRRIQFPKFRRHSWFSENPKVPATLEFCEIACNLYRIPNSENGGKICKLSCLSVSSVPLKRIPADISRNMFAGITHCTRLGSKTSGTNVCV